MNNETLLAIILSLLALEFLAIVASFAVLSDRIRRLAEAMDYEGEKVSNEVFCEEKKKLEGAVKTNIPCPRCGSEYAIAKVGANDRWLPSVDTIYCKKCGLGEYSTFYNGTNEQVMKYLLLKLHKNYYQYIDEAKNATTLIIKRRKEE